MPADDHVCRSGDLDRRAELRRRGCAVGSAGVPTVTGVTVDADGGLAVQIGRALIEVPPRPFYKAWQWRTDAGRLIVCVPDGNLALFL